MEDFLGEIKGEIHIQSPKKFLLEKISAQYVYSRDIIIVVSGFLSEDEDKQQKWSDILILYPTSEVYSLTIQSENVENFKGFVHSNIPKLSILTTAVKATASSFLTIANVGFFVASLVNSNPFSEAFNEAEVVGKYLAYILAYNLAFPNCSINLIGFSLGTEVVNKCLEQYKMYISLKK